MAGSTKPTPPAMTAPALSSPRTSSPGSRRRQPKAWEALTKTHGARPRPMLLDRVRKQLDERGTLDVLRHGVDIVGLEADRSRSPVQAGAGDERRDRSPATRPTACASCGRCTIRPRNENCIDLVLFLNGLPVATAELKTDFTQSVQDAVDQYRFDRNPKPKGQRAEPLLTFPGGALVHFAVSNSEVCMTTRLDGPADDLPAVQQGRPRRGRQSAKPERAPDSYLWEEVWARDSWLEILGRYIVAREGQQEADHDADLPALSPARRHAEARRRRAGGRARAASTSSSTRPARARPTPSPGRRISSPTCTTREDEKLFSTGHRRLRPQGDRRPAAGRARGLRAHARASSPRSRARAASKSGQLAEALAEGKKIIVCTIQTFPFALEAVRELAATQGKRFAVIADEAHSSQTGETAAKLKQVLTAEELAALEDGGEIEHGRPARRADGGRARATRASPMSPSPRPRRPRRWKCSAAAPTLTRRRARRTSREAFHVYSMRQAIEEGFILDVLKNYTPYRAGLPARARRQGVGRHGGGAQTRRSRGS